MPDLDCDACGTHANRAKNCFFGAARLVVVFFVASIILSPFFFVLYRLNIFHTLPYDDYAPYLLWLAGSPEGSVPSSPYAYRIISIYMALPFYYLLPSIDLTNMPSTLSPAWVRATLALDALSYFSLLGASVMAGSVAVRRCGMDLRDGILAGALLFGLGWFTQITAIDGFAILCITLAIYLIDNPGAFSGLLIVSVGANEKIAIVVVIWLTIRCLLSRADRTRFAWQWAAASAAIVLYICLVAAFHVKGNEYQRDPVYFIETIRQNLHAYISPRGVALNLLPVTVLVGIAGFAHLSPGPVSPGPASRNTLFRWPDILVIVGLAGVALMFTQLFQAGRIVMHAAPLFVVPAVAALPRSR